MFYPRCKRCALRKYLCLEQWEGGLVSASAMSLLIVDGVSRGRVGHAPAVRAVISQI